MNRNEKLTEATILALQGKLTENKRLRHKLDEVYIRNYIGTFSELYNASWGPAKVVLDEISNADKEEELMNYLDGLGTEDAPIDSVELNDMLALNYEDIYDTLGLDENGNVKEDLEKTTESVKLEETDVTPDFLNAIKDLFNKYLRITPIKDITIETKDDISILNVILENSNTIKINVTGDSNMAIIKDILNKLD